MNYLFLSCLSLNFLFFQIENADVVPYLKVEKLSSANNTAGSVRARWRAPVQQNGIIVSYTLRYQRVDLEHSKWNDICLTTRMLQNSSAEYKMHLDNGNYSFAVMATSLAGQGPWTPLEYIFIDVSTNY